MKLTTEEKNTIINAANILYKTAVSNEFTKLTDISFEEDNSLFSKIMTTIKNNEENY